MSNESTILIPSRRRMLAGTTKLVLSAGAVALLGNQSWAQGMRSANTGDVAILNVAVGLEYEGINAYAIALKSGLLMENAIKAATKFQDDHKRHNDALIATIRKLGGEPVTEKTEVEYAKALNVDRLKNQDDVLDLAARLELGATNAYLGVIPSFKDPQLAKVAGRLAADEATHWALLNFDLGRPFMVALGFGA
ncbi:MAG TPA: ferritin-like domain-containing protein [Candidatus Binatia bacterium]|nr:ferritin-like domain-containing protein [Candidatus Binatia bacterium]